MSLAGLYEIFIVDTGEQLVISLLNDLNVCAWDREQIVARRFANETWMGWV